MTNYGSAKTYFDDSTPSVPASRSAISPPPAKQGAQDEFRVPRTKDFATKRRLEEEFASAGQPYSIGIMQ